MKMWVGSLFLIGCECYLCGGLYGTHGVAIVALGLTKNSMSETVTNTSLNPSSYAKITTYIYTCLVVHTPISCAITQNTAVIIINHCKCYILLFVSLYTGC